VERVAACHLAAARVEDPQRAERDLDRLGEPQHDLAGRPLERRAALGGRRLERRVCFGARR
jgi:hypothetical protein